MTTIGVVVPNYNGAEILPACLTALASQQRRPDRVLVVDNGSSDDSLAVLREFPGVDVLRLPDNRGFAGGANAGVRALGTTYAAILNSDAVADASWLAAVEPHFAAEGVWAWGSVVLSTRTGLVESAGDGYHPEGRAYKLAAGWNVDALPDQPYEVFAPPGAAPVFRRDVFAALGGYDERFFLYYEDIDLCFRAQLAGWRAVVVPAARVAHDLGASSRPSVARRYIARNSLWCAVQNLPQLSPAMLVRTTIKEARWARAGGYLGPYVNGRLRGVAGLPRALAQRRRVQARRLVGNEELARVLAVPAVLSEVTP